MLTSANRLEKVKPLLLALSDGTKYVLKAPGKELKRDLSIPSVRICFYLKETELMTICYQQKEIIQRSFVRRINLRYYYIQLRSTSQILGRTTQDKKYYPFLHGLFYSF
jgi:hypothetical protein